MNAYLFGWNPIKCPWPLLEEEISHVGLLISKESWTCISHTKVKVSDRAFFVHVGKEPRGLFASGVISTAPFKSKNSKGKDCYRVHVTFDVLLNPLKSSILTIELLNMSSLSKQNWTPQASGIAIRPELVDELELLWIDFLESRKE